MDGATEPTRMYSRRVQRNEYAPAPGVATVPLHYAMNLQNSLHSVRAVAARHRGDGAYSLRWTPSAMDGATEPTRMYSRRVQRNEYAPAPGVATVPLHYAMNLQNSLHSVRAVAARHRGDGAYSLRWTPSAMDGATEPT